ncbi:MAG: IS1595 family transposase [Bacteroidia bacterium]|jgi:transposase-like protein|nr:IS1595 family transposase [Bacteroidia bacterium]
MNVIEIAEKFPEELDAIKFFERFRWKRGKPICPYCDNVKVSKRTKDFRFKCYSCTRTFSVTVNTKLHGTGLELKKWLFAFSIVTDAKKGLSAMQLQRNLSISYPTAFKMYHRIREFMLDENTELDELDGIVEMDETYVGPKRPRLPNSQKREMTSSEGIEIPELDERIDELKEQGIKFKRGRGNPAKADYDVKRGRGTKKIPVVGIVERGGDVVAQVMKNLSAKNLIAMVKKTVDEDKAVLVTDELPTYKKMDSFIERVMINHKKLYSYKGINTNTIESFWAIIKRQIMGQHHHVTAKHLPKYVAEAVFKYNNRNDDDMFVTLVKNAMQEKY